MHNKSRFGSFPLNLVDLHKCWADWKLLDTPTKLTFGQYMCSFHLEDDANFKELLNEKDDNRAYMLCTTELGYYGGKLWE